MTLPQHHFIHAIDEFLSLMNISQEEVENINLVVDSFMKFVDTRVAPNRVKYDLTQSIPIGDIKEVFAQNIQALSVPEALGGLALPYLVYIISMEILSYGSPSMANVVWASGSVIDGLVNFGNEHQQDKFLRHLLKGESIGAITMTEPSGGSSIRDIKTIARKDGNKYYLSGEKVFITNAGIADTLLVFASSQNGMSAFLVPRDSDGLLVSEPISKIGLRGTGIHQVLLNEVEVPEENILGGEGRGLDIAKHIFVGGRITGAALALGISDLALELAVEYSSSRKIFGAKLIDHQLTKEKVSLMGSNVHSTRLSTYFSAMISDRYGRERAMKSASIAKLLTTEGTLKTCDELISIYGGYGYTMENRLDISMLWRDVKGLTIVEGTSDIQKLIISHEVRKEVE